MYSNYQGVMMNGKSTKSWQVKLSCHTTIAWRRVKDKSFLLDNL
jgi:hypothetical protein